MTQVTSSIERRWSRFNDAAAVNRGHQRTSECGGNRSIPHLPQNFSSTDEEREREKREEQRGMKILSPPHPTHGCTIHPVGYHPAATAPFDEAATRCTGRRAPQRPRARDNHQPELHSVRGRRCHSIPPYPLPSPRSPACRLIPQRERRQNGISHGEISHGRISHQRARLSHGPRSAGK